MRETNWDYRLQPPDPHEWTEEDIREQPLDYEFACDQLRPLVKERVAQLAKSDDPIDRALAEEVGEWMDDAACNIAWAVKQNPNHELHEGLLEEYRDDLRRRYL